MLADHLTWVFSSTAMSALNDGFLLSRWRLACALRNVTILSQSASSSIIEVSQRPWIP